jgi:hypothetical protein
VLSADFVKAFSSWRVGGFISTSLSVCGAKVNCCSVEIEPRLLFYVVGREGRGAEFAAPDFELGEGYFSSPAELAQTPIIY